MSHNCEFCGKTLVKKKIKNNVRSKGWHWESPRHLASRRTCNYSCWAKLRVTLQGKTIWDKGKLKHFFKSIPGEQKYRLRWLRENYKQIPSAVEKVYGKKYWRKFLIDLGEFKKIGADKDNPQYRRIASKLLKYWQRELDIKKGNTFIYSQEYELPIDGLENISSLLLYRSLQYLKKLKAIKMLKNGINSKGTGLSKPAQYKLLKTRI